MRILFATPDLLGHGGVQYFSRMALQALVEGLRPNLAPTVVSRMDSTQALTEATGFGGFGARGSRAKACLTLIRALNTTRWDAVILMHAHLAPLLLYSIRRPPTLIVLHGIEAWRPLPRMTRWGLHKADRLLVNSSHTWQRALACNPWMTSIPYGVCHLGVPAVDQDPGAEEPSPEQAPYALTIGRMAEQERYKGFEELIAIWPKLNLERPSLKLVLIGDGGDRARLEAKARACEANAVFLGPVSDAVRDRYLRHCNCFCMPSRGEGFGLVYLEAMRLGKPVLAGSNDAGAEVIVDGKTGRTVDPTDPKQLLAGLLDITGPSARAYGEAGRHRFLERFTAEHFRERFVGQVREILK